MLFLQAANPLSALLDSEWIFPVCELFHIVGFGVAVGTIVVVDSSLFAGAPQQKRTPQLLRDTAPFTLIALVIVLLAGMILFLTDPLEYIYNLAFRFKMVALILAIVYNYTIHRKIALSNASRPARILTGAVSMLLWISVIFAGLFIAFPHSLFGPYN